MLTIEMINEEIQKLEECEHPTWSSCEKLATLYIIKDHFKEKSSPMEKGVNMTMPKTATAMI